MPRNTPAKATYSTSELVNHIFLQQLPPIRQSLL